MFWGGSSPVDSRADIGGRLLFGLNLDSEGEVADAAAAAAT